MSCTYLKMSRPGSGWAPCHLSARPMHRDPHERKCEISTVLLIESCSRLAICTVGHSFTPHQATGGSKERIARETQSGGHSYIGLGCSELLATGIGWVFNCSHCHSQRMRCRTTNQPLQQRSRYLCDSISVVARSTDEAIFVSASINTSVIHTDCARTAQRCIDRRTLA